METSLQATRGLVPVFEKAIRRQRFLIVVGYAVEGEVKVENRGSL